MPEINNMDIIMGVAPLVSGLYCMYCYLTEFSMMHFLDVGMYCDVLQV